MANFDLDENLRASVISTLKEVVLYHPERAARLEPLILRLQATKPNSSNAHTNRHLHGISAALAASHDELLMINGKTPSLRDQFAMAALQGLLASPQMWHKTELTEAIYEIADAMLAAREAGNE